MRLKDLKFIVMLAGLLFVGSATAGTYTDNFSGLSSTLSWTPLGDACLTAGNNTGSIPACSSPKDTNGLGALRLTPASNNQTGAILSSFTPFPLSQGLQVTFTTYTYGGDSGGTAKNGADGIAFFMTDGTQSAPSVAGGLGGSLGYSCSNSNSQYEGMANAYLGLGIDEFGNYLNSGDNTNTGIYNSGAPSGVGTYGSNTYYDSTKPYYQPERIGLRGAGNTTWTWLQSMNSDYYSGVSDSSKVQAACKTGQYVSSVTNGNQNLTNIPYNYNVIPGGYSVLPTTTLIANETAQSRNAAAPAVSATPITYRLTITANATNPLLNFAYSYNNGAFQPVLVNNSITSSNGPLPASLRFGFSAGTGGDNNVHEITCFSATPLQSNSSAGGNSVQSGQLQSGSQLFLATYTSDSWWGSVISYSVNVSAVDGSLSISSTANWDANCDITGGLCPALAPDANGNTQSITPQETTKRALLTWDGSKGSAFEWLSLTAAQQLTLNTNASGTVDSAGSTRLDWLRGVRSNEQTAGNLRARTNVLGDIIDSSPTFVGAPALNVYPNAFTDYHLGSLASLPENASGAQSYSAFATANSSRQSIVYAGSNDGFLHGFAAGLPGQDAKGNPTYLTSKNNGTEVLGFMPAGVLSTSSIVSLTSPTYVHNYFVDATPSASDLFYNKKWHTWLVGGVGTGGSEIYALDVSDPTQFAEATASNVVVGDWTSATPGLSHLGNTIGTPIIARLHSGNWAIIFGNGSGSSSTAGVYVGSVDSTTGVVTFQFLDTGVGSSNTPDGIAYVTSVDLDGDQIADYLYAGDTRGNLWRFDVTSGTTSNWAVSKFGNSYATPLYVAKSASTSSPANALQPISTSAVIAAVTVGGGDRVMVMFGTGQKTPLTSTSGVTYATGNQTFYGIWDWDMSAWNAKAIPSAQYVSLSATQAVDRTKLLQQTLTSTSVGSGTNSSVLGYRNLPVGTVVCWQGSKACSSGNAQYGWLFDLPSTNEQIVYNPAIIGGEAVVNTAIPPVISASTCNPGLQSGWTMAFDPASGGGIDQSFFGDSNGSTGVINGSTVGGVQLNGVGTPSSIEYNGQSYLVSQTVSGTGTILKYNPQGGAKSRVSWKEIRY